MLGDVGQTFGRAMPAGMMYTPGPKALQFRHDCQ